MLKVRNAKHVTTMLRKTLNCINLFPAFRNRFERLAILHPYCSLSQDVGFLLIARDGTKLRRAFKHASDSEKEMTTAVGHYPVCIILSVRFLLKCVSMNMMTNFMIQGALDYEVVHP